MIHNQPVRNPPRVVRKLRTAATPSPSLAPPPPVKPLAAPLADYHQRIANDPIRRAGFCLALVFVFLRFSLVHEVLSLVIGFDPHIVTVVGVPVIILTLLSGGIGRTLRNKISYYWIAFILWMVLAIPFSSWIGGSINTVSSFLRVEFPMLFIIGGLVVTWREFQQMMFATALGAFGNVLTARYFQQSDQPRLELQTGSIGNANDFVAHMLLVLPFVLFVMITPKRSWVIRTACVITIAYGLYLASTAASRGGLVSFTVMCCFILVRASWTQRITAIVVFSVLAVTLLALLPTAARERYATLFVGESGHSEAIDSTRARKYLLETSIKFTLQHPVFGVGPGEFLDFEGSTAVKSGVRGAWQVPHNSYMQVASEEGIPALLLLLATSISAYATLRRIYVAARKRPDGKLIANAAFCVQLSFLGFSCAILFLSLVYNFYLPALGGFAIALQNATAHEWPESSPVPNPAQLQPQMGPLRPLRT